MLEGTGILLKTNVEKHQLLLDGRWITFNPSLQLDTQLIGKRVQYTYNDKKQIIKLEAMKSSLKVLKGKVQSANLSIPRISMHLDGRLVHFYVTEHDFKQMKHVLKAGSFLQFSYHEQEIKVDQTPYYVIAEIKEEKRSIPIPPVNDDLKHRLEDLLKVKYYAFLDLEFSMSGPEYRGIKFTPEIIQVGLIIADEQGNLVEKFSAYIRPTLFPNLTVKTQEFLRINKIAVSNGISYNQFYQYIKDIMSRYQPFFIVWGVSDGFILTSSCTVNNVPPLFEPRQLVDLQRIHRQYYQIGQDIGLYNAIKSYGISTGTQIHDAMVDAHVLYDIFYQFKDVLETGKPSSFKQNYQDIMNQKKGTH